MEFELAREECTFRPNIGEYGRHLSKPHQTLDQIKGVKEKVNMLAKGREIHEKKKATQCRSPVNANNKKGKKKKKAEPKILGTSLMTVSNEKSKYKSCFGELKPAPKRLNTKALT